MENEFIFNGLGECSGLTVLDIGGGTGRHARNAVAAGAVRVGVVDVSAEMLRVRREGWELECNGDADVKDKIRWFEADCTKPLASQVKEL